MEAATIVERQRGSALLLAHCFSHERRCRCSAAERLIALLGGELAQRLVLALSPRY